MENTIASKPAINGTRNKNSLVASTLIGSHSFQHMYARGFLVIIPQMYASLGLVPIQVGLLDAIRQLSGGIFSMGGGIVVDRLQHLRGPVLGSSLGLMALGYLLVGIAPSYILILIALSLASAAGSLWHPPSLGILSQRYPERRGLMISLHRSAGTIGETISPVFVGALLAIVTWQSVLLWAAIPTLTLATLLLTFFWNVGGPKSQAVGQGNRGFRGQFSDLGSLFKRPGLSKLLIVTGIRGMADRGLLLFLPLYMAEELGMTSLTQGIHLALLTMAAIICGPMIGILSDRLGRKPAIVSVMAISTVFAGLMNFGNSGIPLSILIGLMGTVMFSINSLVQAAAMDIAEGKGLEGSLIGLLWGTNAVFGFFPPIILGVLAGKFGFSVIFPYATILYLSGTIFALTLPRLSSKTKVR